MNQASDELVGRDDPLDALVRPRVSPKDRELDNAALSADLLVASEAEDERETLVDGAELIYFESSGAAAESAGIDDRRLLDVDALSCRDNGMAGAAEARRPALVEVGRDENGARAHCGAPAGGRARRGPRQIRRRRSHPGELLADEMHLLAVPLVGREAAHLVAVCRADTAPGRRLAQGGAHCFGVVQPTGATISSAAAEASSSRT